MCKDRKIIDQELTNSAIQTKADHGQREELRETKRLSKKVGHKTDETAARSANGSSASSFFKYYPELIS